MILDAFLSPWDEGQPNLAQEPSAGTKAAAISEDAARAGEEAAAGTRNTTRNRLQRRLFHGASHASSVGTERATRVLITGGTGFIGRALCAAARESGWDVRVALRKERPLAAGLAPFVVGDFAGTPRWDDAVRGAEVVIHAAGLAHLRGSAAEEGLKRLSRVNVEATRSLAEAAAAAGVRRVVLVSSAKVMGDSSPPGGFRESDAPSPPDPYAASKWQAEQALHEVAARTGLEVVVVRTPLVYGPGVPANYLALLRVVDSGVPLPFGRAHNKRSFIFVENLASALLSCATHARAAGKTFFVSDGEDLSTADLVRAMATALGRPARLLPVPPRLVEVATGLLRKHEMYERLFGSLAVDTSAIRETLGWTPGVSPEVGLARTVEWFRTER